MPDVSFSSDLHSYRGYGNEVSERMRLERERPIAPPSPRLDRCNERARAPSSTEAPSGTPGACYWATCDEVQSSASSEGYRRASSWAGRHQGRHQDHLGHRVDKSTRGRPSGSRRDDVETNGVRRHARSSSCTVCPERKAQVPYWNRAGAYKVDGGPARLHEGHYSSRRHRRLRQRGPSPPATVPAHRQRSAVGARLQRV